MGPDGWIFYEFVQSRQCDKSSSKIAIYLFICLLYSRSHMTCPKPALASGWGPTEIEIIYIYIYTFLEFSNFYSLFNNPYDIIITILWQFACCLVKEHYKKNKISRIFAYLSSNFLRSPRYLQGAKPHILNTFKISSWKSERVLDNYFIR